MTVGLEGRYMKDIVINLNDFKSFIVCSDTKENCYVQLLRYLIHHNHTIYGLKKTACGNSHDEKWQDEYTVINDGGLFKDKFLEISKRESSLYIEKPSIVYIDALTQGCMKEWSKPFTNGNGEEHFRYIYFSDKDSNKPYIYKVKNVYAHPIDKLSHEQWKEWYKKSSMCFLEVTLTDDDETI